MFGRVRELVTGKVTFDAATLDEIEDILIASDMGVDAALQVTEAVRRRVRGGDAAVGELDAVESAIRDEVVEILGGASANAADRLTSKPHIILVVGVNGTGKTTSVGKLAWMYQSMGHKVLLGAADTYRAAAIEQLGVWAERIGATLVHQRHGADPAAVAYDAVHAAQSRGADVALIDTAGRLHTKSNLMQELGKIRRAVQKVVPDAPHETLLVLDANTGQNGLAQAREFFSSVDVSGIFLAKLDGTAKGGIVIAIRRALEIPVHFVGVGEQLEDIEEFDAHSFAEALVARREEHES